MIKGVKDSKTGVGAVTTHHDYLYHTFFVPLIELEQGFDQGKGCPWIQDLILMFDLIARVGLESLLLVDLILFFQVEERPRGDTNHEGSG